ncbi:MAG: M28 family peptidase [Planctomycetota bacterium]|jgi:hypothetical protein
MIVERIVSRVLMLAILFGSSVAVSEDLYLVDREAADLDSVASLKDVSIYAVLDNVLLVGASPATVGALQQQGIGATSIGARDSDSEYYFFQVDDRDFERVSRDLVIVYSGHGEAIATTSSSIPRSTAPLLQRLTHISFVPRQPQRDVVIAPPSMRLTDPEIEAIVSQVSEAQYTNYIQTMQNFGTRYSYTLQCRAAEQWAHDTMAAFGYDTELFPFSVDGTWYNAIGRKPGLLDPDVIYMIIGHIDSTSEDPNNSAPGAEDNASGSACVLEAARVLSAYDFDYTLEFVLVSGEEQGLYGSEAYADYCLANNRNIAGVLNFDMIAYAGTWGWDTNIYSDQGSAAEIALADLLAGLTDEYSTASSVREFTDGPLYGSDHYYFSLYGYPAPFSIDAQLWSAPDWYPWYHTTNDVITNLDLEFGTEVVKGAVATLATLANPYTPPLLTFQYPEGFPEVIDPNGGTTFRVEVSGGTDNAQPGTGMLLYDNTGGGFTATPMLTVSPNVYDAVFPALECGTEVLFYVSAETTEGLLATDPRHAPGVTYSAPAVDAVSTVYTDDTSFDKGWTMDGQWAIGQPMGGGGDHGGPDPTDDHSPFGPNSVLGYNLNGDYGNGIPEHNATSPVIDCSDVSEATLTFYRWLGVEQPAYDHAYLQVSNNGATWTTIFENASEIADSSWQEQVFNISEWADGQPNFQFRFVMGPTDSAWQYCGWNIDDLSLTGYVCDPIPAAACCDPVTGSCSVVSEEVCTGAGGFYQGDGTYCQGDNDGDGVDRVCDNCVEVYNPGQEDGDGDGIGDACECVSAEECEDGSWCDGYELCDPDWGCVEGPPQNCSDLIACTVDSCNEATDACGHLPDDGLCDDEDVCNGTEWCDPQAGCVVEFSADCNANDIEDACDISNCPGDPECGDCNSNNIPDECDIAGATSLDVNDNGVPDECEFAPPLADDRFDVIGTVKPCSPPDHPDGDAMCKTGAGTPDPQTVCRSAGIQEFPEEGVCYVARQRYLSVKTNASSVGLDCGYRVCLVTGTAGTAILGYVTAPTEIDVDGPGPQKYQMSRISRDTPPYTMDWTTLAMDSPGADVYLTIGDCEVSPGHDYLIQAFPAGADLADETSFSAPLTLPTPQHHGDVSGGGIVGAPPNGLDGNLGDVFAIIQGFQNTQHEPKEWLDIEPNTGNAVPNMVVNLADALANILAFQQNPYPGPDPLDCP